uniref:Uncharacterized protein n=1 Tax=Rhizophora mucronata TaxID=61149 RepID=A0A2P2R367_RHIMU
MKMLLFHRPEKKVDMQA